jgi:hypothetical protein
LGLTAAGKQLLTTTNNKKVQSPKMAVNSKKEKEKQPQSSKAMKVAMPILKF